MAKWSGRLKDEEIVVELVENDVLALQHVFHRPLQRLHAVVLARLAESMISSTLDAR